MRSVRHLSLSNYRGLPSRDVFAGTERGMTVDSISGHRYIGPALPCFATSSLARPSQSRQSRSRTGNRKRRNLTWHVCVRGRALGALVCACMCVHARADTVGRCRRGGGGGKDIESDSRRTGHNFRPTRSELLMTSLPPPHHSR